MGLLRALDPASLLGAPLTYPEAGATGTGRLPAGYPVVQRSAVVGHGRDAFARAVEAVFDWRMQRAAGLRVRATGSPREVGTVVVLTAGFARLGYDIPCRVVWARTEGDEQGFGYGSLPGHPESGEEAFVVRFERGDDDGAVTFRTTTFSRLASPLARAGGPVSRWVQAAALDRYVAALRRAAAG